MKTNRQNRATFIPRLKHNKLNTFLPPHLTHTKDRNSAQHQTLASIFNSHHPNTAVKLICRKQQIVIDIDRKSTWHPQQGQPGNLQSRVVYSQRGQSKILQFFFEDYQTHGQQEYIFAAKHYQEDVKQFRTSQGDTKASFLSKTSSEKELRPFLPLPKKNNCRPPQQTVHSQISIPQQKETQGSFKRCLSHKNIAPQSHKKESMFTVEELKESLQSEVKESLQSQRQKYNYYPSEMWSDLCSGKEAIDMPGLISFAKDHQDKAPVDDLKATEEFYIHLHKPVNKDKQQQNRSQLSQANQIKAQQPAIKPSQCAKEPSLSLTTNLRKGLIQGSSSVASESLSFKVAGDESIEGEKRRKDQLQGQSMSQIQQLSSITSNARSDIFNKQVEQQQIDSIRCEIEDLNRCFNKNPKKPELDAIEKVDLTKLAIKREQNIDENIQISQKTANPSLNVSEFMVKYNVRFLPKKNEQTEVVRLSPLRFRRKEEVVHTLLKAKIIPKESDSINIA